MNQTIYVKHNGTWYYGRVSLNILLQLLRSSTENPVRIAYKLPDGTRIAFAVPLPPNLFGTTKTEVATTGQDDHLVEFDAVVVQDQATAEQMYGNT